LRESLVNKISYYVFREAQGGSIERRSLVEKEEMIMEIVERILTQNPCYKAGRKIAVKGLMLHSVGCPQPSAEVFVKNWNSEEAARACVHAFIDGNTGVVYQTLPWDHRAWHGGGSSNNTHIGVEMCEPACIKYTGGASFTCSNREEAMAVVKRTYDAAVELFAFLCRNYALDPLADGVIVSHKEGHDRGIASGHGDPDHLWNGLQSGYTMDGFRKDVSAAMGGVKPEKAAQAEQTQKNQSSENSQDTGTNADTIQAGDAITLLPDAVYYTGKEMPGWVKGDKWIVKSVDGDRAVIDKNVSGSNSINSPVHVKYLKLAAKGVQPQGTSGNSAPQKASVETQATNAGEMALSQKGLEMIARYEGCRLEAYQCAAGVWTIGYGHTAGVKQGDRLPSKEAAMELLKEDVKVYSGYVSSFMKKGIISFPMNQNRFDALSSFCYNCGSGNLQKLVSGRDANTVADKMLEYNKGGGKVLEGLVRRRQEERTLFLS